MVTSSSLSHSSRIFTWFLLLSPTDAENVFVGKAVISCELCLCPFWLVKNHWVRLEPLLVVTANAFLLEGKVPDVLKCAIVCPLFKKPFLILPSQPVISPSPPSPVLGKMTEQMVAHLFQMHLDAIRFLDSYQSGFYPGYSTETVVMVLVNEWLESDWKLYPDDLAISYSSLWYSWLWGADKAFTWPDGYSWV